MGENAADLENYKVSHSDGKPMSHGENFTELKEYNLILNVMQFL